MTDDPTRPDLELVLSGAELQRWYWTKRELEAKARDLGVSRAGSKLALLARLCSALDGEPPPAEAPRRAPAAQVTGPLTPDTVIPEGQRCTQHLRRFFEEAIGPQFHFDGHMRRFVHDSAGRTLADAVDHWHRTRAGGRAPIDPQFEFNRFTRGWSDAHPGGARSELLAAWELHRSRPRSS